MTCWIFQETVDNPLKFVFNVDAHISLVRARGKGKKCGPTQCKSAAADRGRYQFDGREAVAVDSVRQQVSRRTLRGRTVASQRCRRKKHRRGGSRRRSDPARAQPLRRE